MLNAMEQNKSTQRLGDIGGIFLNGMAGKDFVKKITFELRPERRERSNFVDTTTKLFIRKWVCVAGGGLHKNSLIQVSQKLLIQ